MKQETYLEVKDVKRFSGFNLAKQLEGRINEILERFPYHERFHVVDQLRRCAESVPKNIEIAEQQYIKTKFNHFSISIGSCKETQAWLDVAKGQNYITTEVHHELDSQCKRIVSILTKTLSNIKNNQADSKDLPSPFSPDIRNFEVYQKSLELTKMVYAATSESTLRKAKGMYDQMRKVGCVPANIAEAQQLYIRRRFKFFNNALEVLNGLGSLLETARSRQLISEQSFTEMEELRISILNMILRTLTNLSRRKTS
jgi:four helix bundle protein